MSVWDADLFGMVEPQAPFLKWPGGKSRIVHQIERMMVPGKRLVEPFVGGASVFLGLRQTYDSYLLADKNADLIGLYVAVRDRLPEFMEACDVLFGSPLNNTKEGYENIRGFFNQRQANQVQQAAMMLWLNRTGFNGIWRVNKAGGFNVPWGGAESLYFPRQELLAFHAKAQRAEFHVSDFRETMAGVGEGDVVYLDPPYLALSEKTASFTGYAGEFGSADHDDLAALCREAAGRGAHLVLSNHDTPAARALYAGAGLRSLDVRRSISAAAESRGTAPELLVSFAAEPQATASLAL